VTTKYLLPCSCGQKIPVHKRQAGQSVQCQCGASLRVPTLLGMAELEQADADEPAAGASAGWGARHRMALLGAVILLGASVALVTLLVTHPPSTDPNLDHALIRQRSQNVTPLHSLHAWRLFRIDGLDPSPDPEHLAFVDRLWKHRLWMAIASAVALVGLGLLAAAFWPRKTSPT